MKVVVKGFLSICLAFFLCISAFARGSVISWYCKRNSTHNQPQLDSCLSCCEDYNLFWCDKRYTDINDKEKVIYLTFDAGYENGNVRKILDALKSEDVKGTFFILDNMILKNENLVKQMIDDGHVVANHTMKHKDMTKMTSIEGFSKELTDLEQLYEKTYGVSMPKFYRPPEGKISEENLKWAKELGYKTVMWSFAYADWDNAKQPTKEYAMKKILDNVHNGEIMLLHPTSLTNAEIMKELIVNLKNQGFRFATVEELCAQ